MVKRGVGRPPTKKGNTNGVTVCGDECAPEFFKVFLPRLASHQLLIPPDFIKHFKRTIKERVVLKDTGGKKWHVDVEETPEGFYLKKGWPSFVEYHRLKHGEFLVFKYDKCQTFIVKIYGTNACKKEITTVAPVSHVKIEPEAECVLEDPLLMSNDKSGCSGEKCDELKEAAENDLPRGPYFISCDSQSTQWKLKIPNEVIDTYNLHSKPEMVLRNSDEKEWPVRIFTVRGVGVGGCMYMGKGWTEFQKENEAGPKDRYMFTFGTQCSSLIIHVELYKTPNSEPTLCTVV
ncbi:hypothetical protein CASFOL_026257 [Castilleja foliolosa]|uniref:TF-B3 domain-containing protein n=1 Tax=Castilleja foliolosa TaxID=1961234 RepID=A0ABD3CJ43_9LAMI